MRVLLVPPLFRGRVQGLHSKRSNSASEMTRGRHCPPRATAPSNPTTCESQFLQPLLVTTTSQEPVRSKARHKTTTSVVYSTAPSKGAVLSRANRTCNFPPESNPQEPLFSPSQRVKHSTRCEIDDRGCWLVAFILELMLVDNPLHARRR